MPLIHTRLFRVRHYECDADGHVNPANYLRYMQEAAFDASAAAGYPFSRYAAMRRLWLVRETEIEYARPLRYGDTVEVRTWVEDFRRVRSRRAYELRLHGLPGLVAHARTDWAFLDMDTERPAPIPRDMIAAFYPEGPPSSIPARERFPKPPPLPRTPFRQQRRVEWRDLDPALHVNNAAYLSYVEEAGLQVTAAFGWPPARLAQEGLALAARHHHIAYRQPALLDDELELTLWHAAPGPSGLIRLCSISRPADGAIVAQARTALVGHDRQTQQPVPIPRQLLADLATNISAVHSTTGR